MKSSALTGLKGRMVHEMSLQIERVRVADVLPLVDEYGNEFLNRDYSLDVNKAYVAELAASFKDGEPDEPIVVVRDGDVFRIKAGNSRVRAMKELGTEECWAIVDDEGTEQAINETVVRTNTKKKYEAVEEALKFIPEGRGYMLNIPDFIIGYKSARRVNCQFGTLLASRKQLPEHSAQRIGGYINWIQRHIDDGWKPGEEQQEVIKLAKRKLFQTGKGE